MFFTLNSSDPFEMPFDISIALVDVAEHMFNGSLMVNTIEICFCSFTHVGNLVRDHNLPITAVYFTELPTQTRSQTDITTADCGA